MNGDGGRDSNPDRGPYADSDLYEVTLTVDRILSLLSAQYRRDLLAFLVDTPELTATVSECVEYVLEQEQARGNDRASETDVASALHHNHLPRLQTTGILEYDSRTGQIRYRSHPHIESWLRHIEAGKRYLPDST